VNQETIGKLDKFFGAFVGAPKPLLLLDYDGTLAPFCLDRFRAFPWPGVRERIERIQKQGRTRIVMISGRPAAEVAPLIGLEQPLEVWGLHGGERLYPDGRRELEQLPPQTRARLDQLRQQLNHDSFGGLFEDKANGAVMHWRSASPEQAKHIEQQTRALFEPLAELDGLKLLKFEAGLELRAGRDKGDAIEAILKEAALDDPRASNPVSFLGDDVTDEDALRSINRAQGPHLSVLVRQQWRETAADVWLRPPDELLEFLDSWIKADRAQQPTPGS
jgi:trehalose 6-phosphate phosphatase